MKKLTIIFGALSAMAIGAYFLIRKWIKPACILAFSYYTIGLVMDTTLKILTMYLK